MEKICSVCKIPKDIDEFPTNGKNKDGTFKHRSDCKVCNYLKTKNYKQNNKDVVHEQFERRYAIHRDELLEKHKIYAEANPEKIAEYHKQYNIENAEKIAIRYKEYSSREEVKQHRQEYWDEYYNNNREEILIRGAEYYEKTKEDRKAYRKKNRKKLSAYYRNRYKTDPIYRLRVLISSGIRKSLNNQKDGWAWEKLVGYTLQDLKLHLESKFDDKMTWSNCGSYWHIDHIVPIHMFNITSYTDESFKKCWSLENLQPLYGPDNLKKNGSVGSKWNNIELAAQLL